MGFDFSSLINSPSEEEGYCQASKVVPQEDESNKKDARESLGIPSVCGNNRPLPQSKTKVVQQCLATQGKSSTSRQALPYSKMTKDPATSLYDSSKPVEVGSTLPPRSDSGDAHRCVPYWVGRPYTGTSIARDLVQYFSNVPHKCTRSDGRFSVLKKN